MAAPVPREESGKSEGIIAQNLAFVAGLYHGLLVLLLSLLCFALTFSSLSPSFDFSFRYTFLIVIDAIFLTYV